MTIKDKFAQKYGRHKLKGPPGKSYKLDKIKDQSPVVYSADAIMKAEISRGGEITRCDDFVLCSRFPSATGIYIVERKRGEARRKIVGQLREGAAFMSQFVGGNCCFFLPVLVAPAPPSFFKELKKKENIIKLGNLPPQKIRHVKTGDSLPPILPPAKSK